MKSGTLYDDYAAAIDWLDGALQRHRLLGAHVLPRLRSAVNDKFASWVKESKAHEIPALVLATHRHLQAESDPSPVLVALERAFTVCETNASELTGQADKLMQVNRSHHAMLQCMVVAAFLDTLGAGRARCSTGARPDLWCKPLDRDVGVEITSHNLDRLDRQELDSGKVSAGMIDMWAKEDFAEFWTKTVAPKLEKASSTEPWMLVAWEADPLYDLLDAVEMQGLFALIGRHGPDPSPLSALVLLPYDRKPEIVAFDAHATAGVLLTLAELKVLSGVFATNPLVQYGLWPK